MNGKEELIWEDNSSQWLNFLPFLLSGLIIMITIFFGITFSKYVLILIPFILIFVLLNYLNISNQKYKLTTQRIIIQNGIFNKITDEIELYRIKDHRLEQPFLLRILGLGNIRIITSDQLNQEVILVALKEANAIRENIRQLVENRRVLRGVRELDTN